MSHFWFSVVVGAIAFATAEAAFLHVYLTARVLMWAGALALLSADMAACSAGVSDVWGISVAVGVVLGSVTYYFAVLPIVRGPQNLYGSAKWATERDLRNAGLVEEPWERLEADEVLFVEPQPCNAPTVKLVTPPSPPQVTPSTTPRTVQPPMQPKTAIFKVRKRSA